MRFIALNEFTCAISLAAASLSSSFDSSATSDTIWTIKESNDKKYLLIKTAFTEKEKYASVCHYITFRR